MTFELEQPAGGGRVMRVRFADRAERDAFMLKPCNGKGGGQRFVRGLQKFVRYMVTRGSGLEFHLDYAQTEAWIRMACDNGRGGYETHLGREQLLPVVRAFEQQHGYRGGSSNGSGRTS